jgi:predicted RNA-binding Zn ribbon-like protein
MTKTDRIEVGLTEPELKLIGGNLSLDFANSFYNWQSGYLNLVAWSAKNAIIEEETADSLIKTAKARPAEAYRVFEQAVKLSDLIYNLFSALAAGRKVAGEDLAFLNSLLKPVSEQLELVEKPVGFEWGWKKTENETNLDQVLWPVIRATADLLTSKELDRVKECPGEGCGRLFIDLSRNRSRKWCDMDHCGMLVKSRNHYAKIRQTRLSHKV